MSARDADDIDLDRAAPRKRGAVVGQADSHPVEGEPSFPRGGKVTIVTGEDGKPRAEMSRVKQERKRLVIMVSEETKAILEAVKRGRGVPFNVAVDAAVADFWDEYGKAR